jgi:hypothetical protein
LTDKSLTTTYEYDSFGNKTKSTITGSGIVSRSTIVSVVKLTLIGLVVGYITVVADARLLLVAPAPVTVGL